MPDTAAIGLLVARYGLPAAAQDHLARLTEALTDPHAPTAIEDWHEAIDLHLADSLSALEVAGTREAQHVVDLGAGAGLPGLALAAALPRAQVTLVESNGRKARFIERSAAEAGLKNATALPVRAEEWNEGHHYADLVTARALAALPVVLEYAAPLLDLGGLVVAWKGRRQPDEETDGNHAAAKLGLELVECRAVVPFPAATDRHLHVYRKVAPTPERYPRRAGMAVKRPLKAPRGT